MSEWRTYSLSDFLLFSASTYRRLFEIYNLQVWPVHGLAILLGVGVAVLLWRGGRRWRLACAGLAIAWAWVAWAFLAQHYSSINWAAWYVAGAFGVQAGLLVVAAAVTPGRTGADGASPARWVAAALIAFGLLVQPFVGPLLGRPWSQAEVFGMVPDPTVTVTLGVLAAAPRSRIIALLWPVPLLWSAASAATLWTMHEPDAAVMPLVAALAVAAAAWRPQPRQAPGSAQAGSTKERVRPDSW